jgi:hypothetical protein
VARVVLFVETAKLDAIGSSGTVSRPIGGVLSTSLPKLSSHPSQRSTWRVWRTRRASSPSPTFDLAPGGVYLANTVARDAGALLPHRFTLACAFRPSAVCSLWHFPASHLDTHFVSTLLCGAPTFLIGCPMRLPSRLTVRLYLPIFSGAMQSPVAMAVNGSLATWRTTSE